MQKELEQLVKLAGTKDFDKVLKTTGEKYKNNAKAKNAVVSLVRNEVMLLNKRLDKIDNEIEVKLQMQAISEIISLSYIANTYFKKTRQWIYQRINGNIVNGKTAKFSDEELVKLQFALTDISRKIGSLSIHNG
jgi:arsenate reductase-like glutaredoxin family protein